MPTADENENENNNELRRIRTTAAAASGQDHQDQQPQQIHRPPSHPPPKNFPNFKIAADQKNRQQNFSKTSPIIRNLRDDCGNDEEEYSSGHGTDEMNSSPDPDQEPSDRNQAEKSIGTSNSATLPLDFSMKKRKRESPSPPPPAVDHSLHHLSTTVGHSTHHLPTTVNQHEMLRAFLSSDAAQRRHSAFEAVTSSLAAVPSYLPHSPLLRSFSAATLAGPIQPSLAAPPPNPFLVTPFLSALLTGSNHQQHQSNSSSSIGSLIVDSGVGSSSSSLPSGNSPDSHHSQPKADSVGSSGSKKQVRPFKAYNPLDPSSALNISAAQPLPAPLLPPAPFFSTAGFSGDPLAAYRNYLLNAALLNQQASAIASAAGPKVPTISGSCAAQLTPSPPQQVTSTNGHLSAAAKRSQSQPRDSSNSPTSTSDLNGTGLSSSGPSSGASISCAQPLLVPDVADNDSTPPLGSHDTGSNGQLTPGQRRRGRSLPEELKDDAYWERRRKNNEAAKRSRDSRRAKEDEIAMRAALLERENMQLRIQVAALKTECEKLRQMLLTNN